MKLLYISVLVHILVLLETNVVEGYFLSATHTRSGGALVSSVSPAQTASKDEDPTAGKGQSWFPSETKKVKYPIIHAIHLRLQVVFGKHSESWWHDWKLWVGVTFWFAVWAKWLIHGYDEIYGQRFIFAFGINIVILHILQYSDSILMGMLVVCSLLAAQSIFQSCIWFHSEPHAEDDADFEADTLYLDLGLPLEQIVILFIAQFGVWWFYMTSILGNFDFAEVNYLFWLWAFLVMQMTMIFNRGADSVLGNAFPIADVFWIIKTTSKARWSLVDDTGAKGEQFSVSTANIIVRGAMGFFCNSILREIMAYTIPLMLMGFSEPMDFVVYCVGVNFICTLDDMSERTYVMTTLTSRSELQTARSENAGDAEQADMKTTSEQASPVAEPQPPQD